MFLFKTTWYIGKAQLSITYTKTKFNILIGNM